MPDLTESFNKIEEIIKKPSFRSNSGRANEVNYWVFDYPPQKELEVRAFIERQQAKNYKSIYGFNLVVFDLYNIIIEFLKSKNYLNKCFEFEAQTGFNHLTTAIANAMKFNNDDSYIINYIINNTPENSVVFLTGIGKCYPVLRSHKILNNLHQKFLTSPVILFFPGTYNEQELILFNEIKDDNYYRAFKLIR